MSVSVAGCVKDIINRSPFISEMMSLDLISFSNLARFIQPEVEAMYGRSVNEASIIMAARRYAHDLILDEEQKKEAGGRIGFEISMKTNIYDVNLRRSDESAARLMSLYGLVKPSQGDFLNVSIGSHEISLSVSDKYRKEVDEIIDESDVIHRFTDLVALTILFKGDFLQTPGILYLAARKLAWEGVNIIEVISTILRPITLAIRLFCNMFAGHIVMGSFSIMATLFAEPLLEHFSAMNALGALPSVAWLAILLIGFVVRSSVGPVLFGMEYLFMFCGFLAAMAVCGVFFVGHAFYDYGYERGGIDAVRTQKRLGFLLQFLVPLAVLGRDFHNVFKKCR